MADIAAIRRKIEAGAWELSRHAVDQCLLRSIRVVEISECLLNGEVIEIYPDDKYGPTCLVLGRTSGGKILHVHCSDETRPVIKIVTAYEPDPRRWRDHRFRRGQAMGGPADGN
jgi:hypothetical protein